MIAPLRRRHRLMITLLALTVPVLVVLAISHRPEHDLQRVGPQTVPENLPAQQEIADLFSLPPTSAQLWQEGDQAVLYVQTTEAPRLPDLLLYWSASQPGVSLPADAVLLAPLPARGQRIMPLPQSTAGGYVLLYSLAHQEMVESAPLPTLRALPEPADVNEIDEVDAEPASDAPETADDAST